MPSRSAVALLGILQRHGLSLELLEVWVHQCEASTSGGMTFYTTQGRITSYEARTSGKVQALGEAQLTKAPRSVHNGRR